MRVRSMVGILLALVLVSSGRAAAAQTATHVSLVALRHTQTFLGSDEVFSTKGTRLPAGDRITSWTATFGDGTRRLDGHHLPARFVHRYALPGTFSAVLVITDAHGRRALARTVVKTIGSYTRPAPRWDLTAPSAYSSDQAFSFAVRTGTWRHLSATVTMDFGDGTRAVATGTDTVAVTHTFSAPGIFPVTVTAVDSRGGIGSWAESLTVKAPPVLNFHTYAEPETGHEWAAYVEEAGGGYLSPITASMTCTSPDAVVTVGQLLQDVQVSATWTTNGTKTVTCTYADQAGGVRHTASTTVDVRPKSVALTGGVGTVSGGVPISATEDLLGQYATRWSLYLGYGAPSGGYGDFPSGQLFTYDDPGTYQAVLSLYLSDGTLVISPPFTVTVGP